ncbi:MAG: hypothetical protein ACRD0V_05355 [Acidimicrobiales bacterium]
MLAINREVASIAEHAVADARRVAINARWGLRRNPGLATGKTVALVAELERTATAVERVAAQTRVRLPGAVPDGSVRVVSLHDPDARPIAKGGLGRPVEFGYKAQVVDNADGSSWTTACTSVTRPTRRCWCPPSPGSSPASDRPRGPSPPTAATARPPSFAGGFFLGDYMGLTSRGQSFSRSSPRPPAAAGTEPTSTASRSSDPRQLPRNEQNRWSRT